MIDFDLLKLVGKLKNKDYCNTVIVYCLWWMWMSKLEVWSLEIGTWIGIRPNGHGSVKVVNIEFSIYVYGKWKKDNNYSDSNLRPLWSHGGIVEVEDNR